MAHNWSKHGVVFNSIDNNCYEAVHCWDESCTSVFKDMFLASITGAYKIYIPLYMLPMLLRRQITIESITNVIKNSTTSAIILAINSSFVIGLTCFTNQFTGKIYYLSPFYNSLIVHLLAFQYERTSRRNSLAMFTMKSTGEILYEYLNEMFGVFNHGNKNVQKFLSIILFSSSIAMNYYLLKIVTRRPTDLVDKEENYMASTCIESDDRIFNSMKTDPLIQILTFISGKEEIFDSYMLSKNDGRLQVSKDERLKEKESNSFIKRIYSYFSSSEKEDLNEEKDEMKIILGKKHGSKDESMDLDHESKDSNNNNNSMEEDFSEKEIFLLPQKKKYPRLPSFAEEEEKEDANIASSASAPPRVVKRSPAMGETNYGAIDQQSNKLRKKRRPELTLDIGHSCPSPGHKLFVDQCSPDSAMSTSSDYSSKEYTNLDCNESERQNETADKNLMVASCCPNHIGTSCIKYSMAKVVNCFTVGFLTQSSLILLKYLRGGYKSSGAQEGVPSLIRIILSDKNSLRFGLFLSSMSFTHRLISCYLRNIKPNNLRSSCSTSRIRPENYEFNVTGRQEDDAKTETRISKLNQRSGSGLNCCSERKKILDMDNNKLHPLHHDSYDCSTVTITARPEMESLISGFISTFISSYLFYDSNQITLYSFWKTAFTFYWYALRNNHESAQKVMDMVFYVSDSWLINCMIMEPQFIANSYLRFVDSITDNMLKRPNIICYQQLTQRINEKRYGSMVPNLNADQLSLKYLQLTGTWSLENK